MSAMYDRIETLCRQNATNVTSMCRALGIPRSILSELRAGRTRTLSLKNAEKIAAFFDVPVETLLRGGVLEEPDDFLSALYLQARELNEENRRRLLDYVHILLLAQQQILPKGEDTV